MTGRICVITATYNSARTLPCLVASLRAQQYPAAEWIVADGGSTDGTLELLKECIDLNIRLTVQKDFGVYDAINRAIGIATCEYYLVVGSDDQLRPGAVAEFHRFLQSQGEDVPDLVAASVESGGKLLRPRNKLGWLYGMKGVASCHSVGLLIRRSLHERVGLYSRRFPIAADQLFVKTALSAGASISLLPSLVAGVYGRDGLSSKDVCGSLTEGFRVQLETEPNKWLQVALFVARVVKNYRRL